MTHKTCVIGAVGLALVFCGVALGDPSVTLTSGQEFTVSSGATGTSGGDIQWTGSAINFLAGSKGAIAPSVTGTSGYSEITLSLVQGLAFLASSNPVPSSSLTVGSILVVETGSSVFAKFLVTANSGGSITFTWANLSNPGGNPGGGGNSPTITAVLDAGSYTEDIAQGSVFVVKGSNLSASGYTATSYPLPPSSNNVSINFTPLTGGSATQALIVYLYNQGGVNQLAGILPSTVSPGNYNVTVTNGTTSAPFAAQVVARKPGLVTQDSTGSGLAVVQNYVSAAELDINRFTTGSVNGTAISPAHPGQTLIAWLTGMGGVPFADNNAPNGGNGYDFTQHGVTVQAVVGGTVITPFYAGRAPCCAGEDQIDFTLPSNIPTGCTVEFHVTVNGVASQSSFISIAPDANATACVAPGYTLSQLQNLDNGGTITTGAFSVAQQSGTSSLGTFTFASAGGEFYSYTGFEFAGATQNPGSTQGQCVVTQIPVTAQTFGGGTGTLLDAGTIMISGPAASALSNTTIPDNGGSYSLTFQGFGAAVNGNFTAGTYNLSGGGGKDVGQFQASMTIPTVLNVSNMPSQVTRSAGLTLNWTGGASSDQVLIGGLATNKVNGVDTGAEFSCLTTAGAGTFTVPSSILNQLPAVTQAALTAQTGTTGLTVIWSVSGAGQFSAPLTAGGSITNANFGASGTTIAGSMPFN